MRFLKALLVFLLIIAILGGAGFAYYYFVLNKAEVIVSVNTYPFKLKIGDQDFGEIGAKDFYAKVEPGTYTIVAQKEDFKDFVLENFNIGRGEKKEIEIEFVMDVTIEEVSDKVISFASLYHDKNELFFVDQGKIAISSLNLSDMTEKEVLSLPFYFDDIRKVTFSPLFNKAVLSCFDKNSNAEKLTFFDLKIKKRVDFHTSIHDVSFSPDGLKIAYVFPGSENNGYLSTANSDGSQWENVDELEFNRADTRWSPDGKYIAVFSKEETGNENLDNKIYVVDIVNKKKTEKTLPGFCEEVIWAPSGSKMLCATSNKETSDTNIWYIDPFSNVQKDLGNGKKACWSKDESAVFVVSSDDYIYKVDLETRGRILLSEKSFASISFVAAIEGSLYFVGNGKLYKMTF